MATLKLPGLSVQEITSLYNKLNEYNQGRASYKEAGAYLVVLPRVEKLHYTLWLYSLLSQRQPLLYICDLSTDIHDSLRMASSMFYYSRLSLYLVAYNEKRMQSNGDDLIAFGKYRGHFLHEILKIDPAYLGWIAYKYTPQIPKQERFVKIAQAYYSVYLDFMLHISKEKKSSGHYLGEIGERLTNLKLKINHIKLEDDPYKTRIYNGKEEFYVKQVLTLSDENGNRVRLSIPSRTPSGVSGTLSGIEHAYQIGEILYVASAKITRKYESRGRKYTCLGHVKLHIPPHPHEQSSFF